MTNPVWSGESRNKLYSPGTPITGEPESLPELPSAMLYTEEDSLGALQNCNSCKGTLQVPTQLESKLLTYAHLEIKGAR